jgi:hypothetical protein
VLFLNGKTLHMAEFPGKRKIGHTQGVLKRKLIRMAEFEITLINWENPGYGGVAPIRATQPPSKLGDA